MYKASDLFFQKQGGLSNQCGKCALNNLLGRKEIDSELLNSICKQLQKEVDHSYKHKFGGDYDVNVLMQALKLYQKQCIWVSGSKLQICKSSQQYKPNRVGYLINRQSKANIFKQMVGLSDRHWIAVRQYNCQYYLLDSKSQSNTAEHIIHIAKFMEGQIEKGSHIIEVVEVVEAIDKPE